MVPRAEPLSPPNDDDEPPDGRGSDLGPMPGEDGEAAEEFGLDELPDVGLDGGLDPLDEPLGDGFDDVDELTAEGVDWTADEGPLDADDELGAAREDGWADATCRGFDVDWPVPDLDDEARRESEPVVRDRGDEGFDEPATDDGPDDATTLPSLPVLGGHDEGVAGIEGDGDAAQTAFGAEEDLPPGVTTTSGPMVWSWLGALESPRARAELARLRRPTAFTELHAGGSRRWQRTDDGRLLRSEDEGQRWTAPPCGDDVVDALAIEGRGVLAVLRPRYGPLSVVRSQDGGRHWAAVEGMVIPDGRACGAVQIEALGALVVVSFDAPTAAPWISRDAGLTWEPLRSLRGAGRLALASQDGVPVLYAACFVESLERGRVVRCALDGRLSVEGVLDLELVRAVHPNAASGEADGDQRVHTLRVEPLRDLTRVWVGCGLGLVQVDLPDGER